MVNETIADLYNVTNIAGASEVINELTGGYFVGMILFLQWFMIFMIFQKWDLIDVLIVNSFFSMLLTFLFWTGLQWIGPVWFGAAGGLLFIFGLIKAFK